MNPELSFRDARPGDEHLVARAVRGIAEAEALLHKVSATPADYARLLFGEDPALRGVIAEAGVAPAGCVLWHRIVFTYGASLGMYLEDVFVEPELRGRGVGRALIGEMARRALACGYTRIHWSVKNDNLPAQRFYERLGAEKHHEFTTQGLTGAALVAVAAS